MRKFFSLHLVLIIIFLSVASVAAQEAMSESYFQAALDAYGKENYNEAVRFARLGLSEVENLKTVSPKTLSRLKIRGFNILSAVLIEQKKYADAESVKREEITVLESIGSQDYPEYSTNYPMSLESLGFILSEQNKYAEAEKIYRQALIYREKVYGVSDKSIATSLINMGNLYRKQGKYSEAEVMSKRAFGIFGEAIDNGEFTEDDTYTFLRAARLLAQVKVEGKKYAEAEKTYKLMIPIMEKNYGRQDSNLIEPLEEYAKLLRILKRPLEATKIETRIKQLKLK
jgi:tetratricopeptide (TPR) repeat protein